LQWALADRFAMFTLLQNWAKAWTIEEQTEIMRQKGAKDTPKRDEKRIEAASALQWFPIVMVSCLKDMIRTGRILPKQSETDMSQHISSVITWMLMTEMTGINPLRWFVSYHLEESLPVIINMSYEDMPRVQSALLIESICCQFVSGWGCDSPGVVSGEEAETASLAENDLERVAAAPLSLEDLSYRNFVSQHSAELFCLLFLHATHATPKV
jgi:hypothetical protein